MYANISTFVVFQNISMATLTLEEEDMLRSKVHKLKPMCMGHVPMFPHVPTEININ